MNTRLIGYLLYVCLLPLVMSRCTPNSERILNTGIKRFEQGETAKAITMIEKGIIDSVTIKHFSTTNLSCSNNLIYYRNNDYLKIAYPHEMDIMINNNSINLCYDPVLQRVGLLNGMNADIFNMKGALVKDVPLNQANGKEVKAIALLNDKLYYYCNRRIYFTGLHSNNAGRLVKDRFSPPFSPSLFYLVQLQTNNNKLAIIVGIGGSYNMSVIDLSNSSIMLQNWKISSSKISFQEGYLYCITGSTGNWTLRRISIYTKKRNILLAFNNLIDLELTPSGIIYENNDGLWIMNYSNKRPVRLPFRFKLAGRYLEHLLIRNDNGFYLIDMNKFLDIITYLNSKIPSLFEKK
ncbi:MAG: hypothetical protein SVZ03_10025 [Spirochaetota bacterium]|nr:hypothetical protein [Spirochaetota bacterium]